MENIVQFLGDCIDRLYDINALLRCQDDALMGLTQHHSDYYHLNHLNNVISHKLSKVSNEIDEKFKELREAKPGELEKSVLKSKETVFKLVDQRNKLFKENAKLKEKLAKHATRKRK